LAGQGVERIDMMPKYNPAAVQSHGPNLLHVIGAETIRNQILGEYVVIRPEEALAVAFSA